MTDLATLQTRLAEAEAAYHQLLTGAKAATVGSAGRNVSYTQADAPRLAAYISNLKSQVAALDSTSASRRRRALTVTL